MIEAWLAVAIDWPMSHLPEVILIALVKLFLIACALWVLLFPAKPVERIVRRDPEPDHVTQPSAHFLWREENMSDAEREAWEEIHLPRDLRVKREAQ